jgi:hypothetical protein
MMVTRLPWMAQRLVSKKSVATPVGGLYTFKHGDKVSLNSFLEGTDGRRLESEIGLEVLGNFSDETLEGQLADQELSRLLVTTDFTKSDRTGAVTMGLLDTSGTAGMSDEWPNVWAGIVTWGPISWQPWRQVVCEVLCHQSTCGQFA